MATKKRTKAKTRVRSRKGSGRESVSTEKKRKQTPAQKAASLRNLAKARKALAKQRKAAKVAPKKATPKTTLRSIRRGEAVKRAPKKQTKEELRQELAALKKQLKALEKKPAKKASKAKKKPTEQQKAAAERQKAAAEIAKHLEVLKTTPRSTRRGEPQAPKGPLQAAQDKLRAASAKKIQEAIRPRKKHAEVLGSPGYNRPWVERRDDGKLNLRYMYRARGGETIDTGSVPAIIDEVYSGTRALLTVASSNNVKRYVLEVTLKVSGPEKMIFGAKYYDHVSLNVQGHKVVVADVLLGFINSGPNTMDTMLERLAEELNESKGRYLEGISITIYENK